MEISGSLLRGFARHAAVLAERGKFDPSDAKAADALRLIRKEIKQIERRLGYAKD